MIVNTRQTPSVLTHHTFFPQLVLTLLCSRHFYCLNSITVGKFRPERIIRISGFNSSVLYYTYIVTRD